MFTIEFNNTMLTSKTHMKVLGMTFDSKLNWGEHISNFIKKSNKSLQTIKIIKMKF